MKTKFKLLCSAVALSLAGQAYAATDWLLTSATVSGGAYVVGTVTATGWADTGTGSPMLLEQQVATGVDSTTKMKLYGGGLGINNRDGCASAASGCDVGDLVSDAPEHALDNNERYEMVMLSFTQSVKLTNAKVGWTGTDSDITVLAYTGVAGQQSISGKTWDTLGSGWTKIGNYSDLVVNDNRAINAGNTYSSYWLIGAYNPLAGGNSGYTLGNDYVKLAAVTGVVCVGGTGPNCGTPPSQVPEPGSLALVGFALMGMMGLRKRRQV